MRATIMAGRENKAVKGLARRSPKSKNLADDFPPFEETSQDWLEDPKKEFLYCPSPKRILSKMKNAELAARVSDLICVAETMGE